MKQIDNRLVTIPNGYAEWRGNIETLIEQAKLRAVLSVNTEMLTLYWHIGREILQKQQQQGWGSQVVRQLSHDLRQSFPDDKGYSERNLNAMLSFARAYPDFPILQVPLAKLEQHPIRQDQLAKLTSDDGEFVQVPLAQIDWYHHISLIPKVKDNAERAFYILETAANGWSRDTMMLQIANGYIHAKGKSVNNFRQTLPPYQSDLARYAFKDPYKFSFLGTVALQNEFDIERSLASRITDFLLEMWRGDCFSTEIRHLCNVTINER